MIEIDCIVRSRCDLTHQLLKSLEATPMNFKEYHTKYLELRASTGFATSFGERLIQFFVNYKEGLLTPEKSDSYEPIRGKFDQNSISEQITWIGHTLGHAYLQRRRAPWTLISIENHRIGQGWESDDTPVHRTWPDPVFLTEVWTLFKLSRRGMKKVDVRRYLTELASVTKGDFGMMTTYEYKRQNHFWFRPSENPGMTIESMEGLDPAKCIPGIYWLTYFSKNYVDWFGRQKVLSSPAHRVFELDHGGVVIQVAEDIEFYKTEERKRIDEIVDHLGRDAFFDLREPERKCRVPDFSNWPEPDCS